MSLYNSKIKKYFDHESVAALIQQQGFAQRTNITAKIEQYYDVVFKTILNSMKKPAFRNEHKLEVCLTSLRSQLGRYNNNGQTEYWYDWFTKNAPLMKIVTRGYKMNKDNKKNTVIESNIPLEILVAGQDSKSIISAVYANIDKTQPADFVKIDLRSLDAFIRKTTVEKNELLEKRILTKRYQSRLATMERNIVDAIVIKTVAEANDGYFVQFHCPSDFGRLYFQGLNLQNVHRQVRHAALGDCLNFDIESAVFAWKHETAKTILIEAGVSPRDTARALSYTSEYVELKQQKRLYYSDFLWGNQEENSVKTVKQIFTAIGFGADPARDSYWNFDPINKTWDTTAFNRLITSSDKRNALRTEPWFAAFIKEQEEINDLIFSTYKHLVSFDTHPYLYNKRKGLVRNKFLAFMYQTQERALLEKLCAIVQEQGGTVHLKVHDGFYATGVNSAALLNLKTAVADEWPLSKLAKEEISGYSFYDNTEDELHKERIRAEELAANDSKPWRPNTRLPRYSTTTVEDYFAPGIDRGESAYFNPVTATTVYSEVEHLMDENMFHQLKQTAKEQSQPLWVKELLRANS